MSTFYKTSTVWAVDFTFDGHPRRWLRALPAGADAQALMQAALADLHGPRAQLLQVRPATADEEAQYLRDDAPPTPLCPTGRGSAGVA
jgi:hypothetical protein